MPKKSSRKSTKPSAKSAVRTKPKVTGKQTRLERIKQWIATRRSDYLSRRPHRSFALTRRRDYARSLQLPGYWSFTASVWKTLWAHKRLFGGLIAFYALAGMTLVGLASQDVYSQLSQLLDETGSETFTGGWGTIGQAGLLVLSGMSGGFNTQLTDVQQVSAGIILLLTWLTTVWLLRGILAGNRPNLRDGLYNAGAPIVATGLVMLIVVLQLMPATIGIIAMNAAMSTNLFESGFMAMAISVVVALLVLLSLYWLISSFFAMVIVTLPGMYPIRAIKAAGDLVIGRRVRIMLRIGWLLLGNILLWVLVVLIAVLFDRYIKNVLTFTENIPIVPFVITVISSVIIVWSAAYVYLLYRKVVDDDAAPA